MKRIKLISISVLIVVVIIISSVLLQKTGLLKQELKEQEMAMIYPYLKANDNSINEKSGQSVAIGNGVYYEYVRVNNGKIESLNISKMGNKQAIQQQAMENLKKALHGEIHAMSFDDGPGQSRFVLIGNHWTAATQILDPDLFVWAQKVLKVEKFIISIPHMDTLLIFPMMDEKYFPEIKRFVIEKEIEEKNILTFELFELSAAGLKSLQ